MVAVGMVKKSVDARSATWLVRKGENLRFELET